MGGEESGGAGLRCGTARLMQGFRALGRGENGLLDDYTRNEARVVPSMLRLPAMALS